MATPMALSFADQQDFIMQVALSPSPPPSSRALTPVGEQMLSIKDLLQPLLMTQGARRARAPRADADGVAGGRRQRRTPCAIDC